MKLAFQIAWRFLTSAKRQTLIIILGISVGVSVQVFIGSLISGLQASLVGLCHKEDLASYVLAYVLPSLSHIHQANKGVLFVFDRTKDSVISKLFLTL